jgi:transposase
LSVWFYHALTAEGIPAICIDARHAKAALDMAPNKTDANDADGLAQLAEVGFCWEVRVKKYDSMLSRTRVGARNRVVKITIELSNLIRGVLKTFGLIVGKGSGRVFDGNVRTLLAGHAELAGASCLFSRPGVTFAPGQPNSTISLSCSTGTPANLYCFLD